ncbi:MAG: beta-galactosidase [Candidatus Omnitrophota bacterium]
MKSLVLSVLVFGIWLSVFFNCKALAGENSWDFNNAEAVKGWVPVNLESIGVSNGVWKLAATGNAPQIYTPDLKVDAAACQYIVFQMKIAKDITPGGNFIFATDTAAMDVPTVVSFQPIPDGEFHTYKVDMGKNPLWKGTVLKLRFHPFYVNWPIPEDQRAIEIAYMHIVSQSELPKTISQWEFNTAESLDGWEMWQDGSESKGIVDGVWKLVAKNGTPWMFTPTMEVDAANQPIVVFRMRIGKGLVSGAQILFVTDQNPNFNDNMVVTFQPSSDGEFHVYEIDMSKNPFWKGNVLRMRFHPIYCKWPIPEEQRTIEIDYFRIPDLKGTPKADVKTSGDSELIANGGFEKIDNNGIPPPWKRSPEAPLPLDVSEYQRFGDTAACLVSDDAHSGSHSIQVNIPAGKDEIGGWAERITMKPKSLYKLTCWAKSKGTDTALLVLNEYKAGGVRTALHMISITSEDWKEYAIEFTSKDDTEEAQIKGEIWRSSGQAWWDDFSLREINLSTAQLTANIDETPYTRLTGEVVTPHITWAIPYAIQPIRILAIPRHREVVELAQRLSIDYTAWSRYTSEDETPGYSVMDTLYYAPRGRGQTASLIELKGLLDRNPEVILIGTCNWQALPQSLKDNMLEKVKQGTGLVFIRPSKETKLDQFTEKPLEQPLFISIGIPFPGLTVLDLDVKGQQWLKCYACGKGRVVIVDYQNEKFGTFESEKTWFRGKSSPFTPDVTHDYRAKPLYYDYYQSLLAKLVLWAARKEGDFQITGINWDLNNNLKVRITNSGITQEAIAEIVVRDPDGNVEAKYEKKVSLPAETADLGQQIGRLKSGPHFADFWLKKDGKTLVWGSTYFQTVSDHEITAVTTDKFSYNPGEAVTGKVSFNKELSDSIKVKIQFSDGFGRIMEEKVITASGKKEVTFQLPFRNPVAIYHTVKADLIEGNGIISEKTADVIYKIPQKLDDFQFWFWANMLVNNNDFLSRYMLTDLYNRGFDVAYAQKPQFISHEQVAGILSNEVKPNLVPALVISGELACSGGGYDVADTVRPRCLTSKQFRDYFFHVLQDQASVARDYPIIAYSLGDEVGIGLAQQDFCFSPTCLEYTRNYLKSIYGDLGKLNEAWGTNFDFWDQVKCMTLAEAKAHGNFAPWTDLRTAMEDMFANLIRESRDIIRKEDPGARVGTTSPTSTTMYKNNGEDSFYGYDFGKVIPQGNYWGVYFQYNPPQMEFLRSFALPNTVLQTFTNPFEDYPKGYYEDTWRSDQTDRFIPWYDLFHGMNSVHYWDAMDTQWYGFYSCDLRFTPWAKNIVETIGEIKCGAGKLLLECRRENNGIAIHYSPASFHAETILGGRERVESPRAFCNLLEDLGLQYDFISKEQMQQGKLADYRVLILPYSRAIRQEEAAAMKAFAAKGGLILADGEAGVMDEHCKYVKTNMLAGVNVIKIANPIWKYREVKNGETGSRYRGEISTLLGKSGVKPKVTITPKNNKELTGCEIVEFKNGPAIYLGILQGREYLKKANEDHTPQAVTVQLPGTYHVYSVRDNHYLGFVNKIDTVILPAVAKLYALLPCKVNGLTLENIEKEYTPGMEVKYSIRAATLPAVLIPQVAHVEVTAPGGRPYKEYGRNLSLPSGKGEGSFSLALNDPAGEWRIIVTDVATGIKTERIFKVK